MVNGRLSERWIKREREGFEKEIEEDEKLIFGKSNVFPKKKTCLI